MSIYEDLNKLYKDEKDKITKKADDEIKKLAEEKYLGESKMKNSYVKGASVSSEDLTYNNNKNYTNTIKDIQTEEQETLSDVEKSRRHDIEAALEATNYSKSLFGKLDNLINKVHAITDYSNTFSNLFNK